LVGNLAGNVQSFSIVLQQQSLADQNIGDRQCIVRTAIARMDPGYVSAIAHGHETGGVAVCDAF